MVRSYSRAAFALLNGGFVLSDEVVAAMVQPVSETTNPLEEPLGYNVIVITRSGHKFLIGRRDTLLAAETDVKGIMQFLEVYLI